MGGVVAEPGQRVAVVVEGGDDEVAWLVARGARLCGRVGARLDVLGVGAADEERLSDLLDQVPEAQRGRSRLLIGKPLDAIVEAGADYDAVVVRPSSSGVLHRLVRGDFALQLIGAAPCAVLFPRGPERDWRDPVRALVGVFLADPGVPFLLAVDWAGRLGALLDVSLTDPNVIPWVDDADHRRELTSSVEDARADDRKALDRLLASLPEGMRGVRRHGEGLPDDVLVDLAPDYDLVLVGNRPRGGLTGTLRGSIAEHVVRHARTDVLVLPSRRLVQGKTP